MDELVWVKAIPYRITTHDGCGASAYLDGRLIAASDACDTTWALGAVLLACVEDAKTQWKGTGRGNATDQVRVVRCGGDEEHHAAGEDRGGV